MKNKKEEELGQIGKIEAVIEKMKIDYMKFYSGGNKAAGTRVRKHCQEIKSISNEIRHEVMANKKRI